MTEMNPDERLRRIESLIKSTAKQQVRSAQDIDKHNEAIRRLIIVGRTCLDSIKELRADHKTHLIGTTGSIANSATRQSPMPMADSCL
jgi:hypothetical protein